VRWIWVRHGETDENRERRYLGHSDPALNQKGREQALQLRHLLAHFSPRAVYTSDRKRCMETATCLAEPWKLSPEPVEALRELSFGEWDGLTYEEIRQRDEARLTRWYRDPFQEAPPGGETLEQLGQRVDRWVAERFAASQPDETAVIVTHGGVIRWFQCRWLMRDPSRFWNTDGLGHGEALLASWDGRSWTSSQLKANGGTG